MAREGRELELLIEKLEKSALPEGATIKSPDFIIDKITGTSREVDISIRYKLGTIDVLAVIECRDRTAVQDVTWIEQMNTKVRDLNANKIIAVSSSSFSEGAAKKAEHYGIETRTFSEISYEMISSWWRLTEIPVHTHSYSFVNVTITLDDNLKLSQKYFEGKKSDEKFIVRLINSQLVSIDEVFRSVSAQIPEWGMLLPNGIAIRKSIKVDCNIEGERIYVKDGEEQYFIVSIDFIADLFIVEKRIPIAKISSYEDKNGVISSMIEYKEITHPSSKLQFIKNPNGTISMTFLNE